MAFIAQVGRKANELASEYVRRQPTERHKGSAGVFITKEELEILLERALIEGVRIGQDQTPSNGEAKKPLDIPHK